MNKIIAISGGSDGLGKSIAARLAPHHTVIILSRSQAKCEAVAAELGCEYEVCDVSDYDAITRAVASITARHGRIDVLVNNAGLWIQGPLDGNEVEQIQQVFAVNTLGTIQLTKAVIPVMKQEGSGRIFNVISQAGLTAKANLSVYNASKWAITGFTKALQQELAPAGISVTGVYPGKIKTDLFKKAGVDKDMSGGLTTDEVAKIIEFALSLDPTTVLPEIGIKHLQN